MKFRGKQVGAERRIRRAFRAEGEVQGVGFRWRARRLAEECGVCGVAENACDGTVRLVAEGGPEAIGRFAMLLRMGFPEADISEVGRETRAEGLEGFEIR